MAAAAAILFCRRVPTASKLLGRLLNPARIFAPSSSAIRSFNTKAQMTSESDSDEKPSDRISRRGDDKYLPFFSGSRLAFRSLFSGTALEDDVDELYSDMQAMRFFFPGMALEDADELFIRMEMPGLSKEHVKVSVENDKLIICGENEKEAKSMESRRRYTSRLDVPDDLYKVDEIKAEMVDGMLIMTVPKVKVKEKEVRQVQIE